jgi:hypothetical protein
MSKIKNNLENISFMKRRVDAGLVHPNDMNDFEMAWRLRNYLVNVHSARPDSMYVKFLNKIIINGELK